jgi:hypothetical protein
VLRDALALDLLARPVGQDCGGAHRGGTRRCWACRASGPSGRTGSGAARTPDGGDARPQRGGAGGTRALTKP